MQMGNSEVSVSEQHNRLHTHVFQLCFTEYIFEGCNFRLMFLLIVAL